MNFVSALYRIILDSLFPLNKADEELFSLAPENAGKVLPKSPSLPITKSYSIFAYKNPLVKRLVWNIKYKKNSLAIKIGGYALFEKIEEMSGNDLDIGDSSHSLIIVPIPMTTKRHRERGFNQCELLVDEIHRLDVGRSLTINKDILIRTRHASRQTLKNRSSRLESAKGIFAVNFPPDMTDIPPKKPNKPSDASPAFNSTTNKSVEDFRHFAIPYQNTCPTTDRNTDRKTERINHDSVIIIIDDVITTGSTMKEAIKTFERAGFKRVIGLSLAH